jgi:hypothetical protein
VFLFDLPLALEIIALSSALKYAENVLLGSRGVMHSGGQEDPSEVIQRLLGEDSLLPQGKRGGWVVNLDSKVFQELELLQL